MRPVQPNCVNVDTDRIIKVIYVSVDVSLYYILLKGAAQLANWRATDSCKPCHETKCLRVLNEGSFSWHTWKESVGHQFAK